MKEGGIEAREPRQRSRLQLLQHLALALAVSSFVSCSDSSADGAELLSERDSAGVTIVEYRAALDEITVPEWKVSDRPLLSISGGGHEGPPTGLSVV